MKKNVLPVIKVLLLLFGGFFLCALGMLLMLYADLGANPWVTFQQGISNISGISIGKVSQIIGLVIILLSIPLKIFPGIATILNMYFIGFFMDLIESGNILFTPSTLLGKIPLLLLGMILLSIGIFIYLKNGLGAGPRDGLMIGLMRKLNLSVTIIKTSIEVIVLVAGILLGGPLGIGTAISAFGSGYFLDATFKIGKFDSKSTPQRTLKDEWKSLREYKKRIKVQGKKQY